MRQPAPPRSAFALRLDPRSGVPVYRQLIDQVQAAIAVGALRRGDQLPTVRQVAVDLEVNPNTVMRAWRELELLGFLDSQQGTGTFVGARPVRHDAADRARQAAAIAAEALAKCGAAGIGIEEVVRELQELLPRPARPGR